jgi:phospholipid/cholesterol/gamma-HCH transport system substrate-binding protein
MTSMGRRALIALSAALALSAVLLAAIFAGHGAFSRSATLYFVTDSANGLAPGTAVKLSGFRIGAVSALHLEPDLSVLVTLKIPLDDFQRLRSDAKAELRKEDVVQAATLEIHPGRSAEPLAPENPHIAFDRGRSIGQTAQDLTDRLAPILEDVKALTGMLNDREHGLAPMLRESRSVSRDLAATAAEIRALAAETRARFSAVGARAQGTLGEATAAFSQLNRMAGKAQQSLGRLDDALPGLLLKISGTLDSVQEVVKDARTVSAAASESVPRTLREVQPMVEDAREVIRGVKQSWPVRNMVPAPSPAALPIDSSSKQAAPSAADINQDATRAWQRGDLARALALYAEALAAAEATEDYQSAAANLLNLELVHERLGQFPEAHARLDPILARPALYGATALVQASARKARLYLDAHDLDSALLWIGKTEAACGGGCPLAAALTNMQATVALEQGDAPRALQAAARVLALGTSPELAAERADAYRTTGRAQSRTGRFGDATAALEKALEIDRAGGRPDRIALDLVYQAENEELRGQPAQAREYYLRARTVYAASGDQAGAGEMATRLARLGGT